MPTVAPRWEMLACDQAASERLASELGIAPIVARLLCQRGLSDPALAHRFLNPSLDHLHDPMLLAGMSTAVDR
ncbi:MAG: single-stranded-DNA-specific exonuclease RecJ, partial [Vicinamibacterales bacterium]